MAHVIIHDGVEYPLHIAEFNSDREVRLYPFESEIHSTRFIPGRVEIRRDRDGYLEYYPLDARL